MSIDMIVSAEYAPGSRMSLDFPVMVSPEEYDRLLHLLKTDDALCQDFSLLARFDYELFKKIERAAWEALDREMGDDTIKTDRIITWGDSVLGEVGFNNTHQDHSILSASSKGSYSAANGSFNMYDYLNALIPEVCIKGDVLSKYDRLLHKMDSDGSMYGECAKYIAYFDEIKQKGQYESVDRELLHQMGETLHLTEETMGIIDAELDQIAAKTRSFAKEESITYEAQSSSDDHPSVVATIVSFIFPIIGWILYFVLRNKWPQKAKACSKAAWISVAINVAFFAIGMI